MDPERGSAKMAIRCLYALPPQRAELYEEATNSVDFALGAGHSGREHCLVLLSGRLYSPPLSQAVQTNRPNCYVEVDR
jgi:hypothetical protein